MVQLVNAGIRGARAAAGKDEMQVMIHLDQGGRYFYLKEWFDGSFAAGLEDFDLIGLSYYPFWHWHPSQILKRDNDEADLGL